MASFQKTLAKYKKVLKKLEIIEREEKVQAYKELLLEKEKAFEELKEKAIEDQVDINISENQQYQCIVKVDISYDEERIQREKPMLYSLCLEKKFSKSLAKKCTVLNQYVTTEESTYLKKRTPKNNDNTSTT